MGLPPGIGDIPEQQKHNMAVVTLQTGKGQKTFAVLQSGILLLFLHTYSRVDTTYTRETIQLTTSS